MGQEEEIVGSVKDQLERLFEASLKITAPDQTDAEPLIAVCNNRKHGDYQWYNPLFNTLAQITFFRFRKMQVFFEI